MAHIFNNCPGLEALKEEKEAIDAAKLVDDGD